MNLAISLIGGSSSRVCRPGGSIATSSTSGPSRAVHGRNVAAPPPANGKQIRRARGCGRGRCTTSHPPPDTWVASTEGTSGDGTARGGTSVGASAGGETSVHCEIGDGTSSEG